MKAKQVDFSSGSIRANIMRVAAPMFAAQLLNLLYNIVDRMYIGQIPEIGATALGGIGLCFPIISIITAFSNLYGAGGAPLCSIERGRGNFTKAHSIMENAFAMLVLTGIVLTILGLVFHHPILYLFGASDITYGYASDYITIYMLGTIFVMITLGMNPFINSQGFAKIGMYTVLLGALTNIILDPILIFGFRMGVRGAAIATIVSQLLSTIWVMHFLTGGQSELQLHIKKLSLDFQIIKQIVALGSAGFMMSCTDSLVQIACNSTLQQFGGDIYITVMTILNSVRQIASTPVMSVTDGASPVIGYNYGAKRYKNVIHSIWFVTIFCVLYTTAIWLVLLLFPQAFIRIFNQDTALIAAAIPSMHIYFFGFFMMSFQFAGQTVFRSLDKARQAVFFSILRKLIIVVPLTFLLPHVAGLGVNGVFLAEPISNLIGGTACFVTMYLTVLKPMKKQEI